jgi:sugar/nucleoside kinase (ribokinase family)
MTRTSRSSHPYAFDFFSVGQVTLDTIVDHRGAHGLLPGGGALYPALVATQLGLCSAVYGKVGSDFPSRALAKLRSTGLNTQAIRRMEGETGRITIDYSDGPEEKISIFPGLGYDLSTDEIPKGYRNSRVIHVSTAHQPFLESFLESVRKQDYTFISFAPKSDLKLESPETIARLFSKVDAVFCNEFELALYSTADSTERRLVDIATKGPNLIVVTLGERGSLVYSNQEVHKIRAFRPGPVRSLCGAGDAYLAGFWCAYLRGCSLYDCGVFASRVAVSVMRGYGLPLKRQIFERLSSDHFCREILAQPMVDISLRVPRQVRSA